MASLSSNTKPPSIVWEFNSRERVKRNDERAARPYLCSELLGGGDPTRLFLPAGAIVTCCPLSYSLFLLVLLYLEKGEASLLSKMIPHVGSILHLFIPTRLPWAWRHCLIISFLETVMLKCSRSTSSLIVRL